MARTLMRNVLSKGLQCATSFPSSSILARQCESMLCPRYLSMCHVCHAHRSAHIGRAVCNQDFSQCLEAHVVYALMQLVLVLFACVSSEFVIHFAFAH